MTRLRCAALFALAVCAAAGGRTVSAADSTAPELAAALQRKYASIKDFSADFTHTYEGGVLRKQITERGHLLVKKPGMMRWDYSTPEPKQFVSDGVKMYSYIPQDKQVIVAAVPPDEDAPTPTLFLAGKGNVTRDFTPSLVDAPPGMPAGSRTLKLIPKARQRDYDWLVLVLDPDSLAIRGLLTVDAQGGKSSFLFTNLKENVGLADKEFAFKIPRGVDVVTAPSRN
ncbi:MAG TPA: outer membrane lipoprotein chaperone LolA [Vicinamibacterales bacterium]|jgi:outer membrane lipoprotein carrier protein|nr:outer membrane lipoprotein chaperone LolA [Vicinamibacterales bacterium]